MNGVFFGGGGGGGGCFHQLGRPYTASLEAKHNNQSICLF